MKESTSKVDVKNSGHVSVLKRMLKEAAPYRSRIFLAILLSLMLAILAPIRPWLIQMTINLGISHPEKAWYIQGPGGFIVEITLIQIGLLLLETFMKFLFSITTATLGQYVVRDLRQKIHRSILKQPLSMFDRTPVGMLTTRTVNDIESVNDIFSDGFIPIMADLLTILSVLIYMFGIDWKLTLICLLPFPFLLLATWFFKESVNRSFMRVRQAVTQLNTFVQEHLTGMSVIQAFTAEHTEQSKFEEINREHREANVRAIFAYSVFFPVVELASALSIGFLVWWAAHASTNMDVINQAEMVSKATAFILCIQLLFRPLRIMADKFNVLQMGMIAAGRVFQVMDQPVEIETASSIKDNGHVPIGDIVFDNVSFSYVPGQQVLKEVSFRVPEGTSLAIVGKTGSGKTTLASLLCRLYIWDQGTIYFGDKSIREISLDQLRSSVGVVMQDAFLFSGSLMDNITLRNPDITEEKAWLAIGKIGLTDWVEQLPGKLQYQVLERGSGLSMGQRQLITFIRAVLYDPPILILDEATASVDAQTERWIQKSMHEMLQGRTSIIIAHRLSTIREADAVLVMDNGEVKECGRPDDLISMDGWFASLHRQQWVSSGKGAESEMDSLK